MGSLGKGFLVYKQRPRHVSCTLRYWRPLTSCPLLPSNPKHGSEHFAMTNPFLALVIVLVAMLAIGNWLCLVGILCELQARLPESRSFSMLSGGAQRAVRCVTCNLYLEKYHDHYS